MTNLTSAASSLFYYVNSPVTNMREHPQHESEIVSQVYFSEEVHILEAVTNWTKIKNVADSYQGWIQNNSIFSKVNSFSSDLSSIVVKVSRCAAHLYGVQDTVYGPILTLPFDSKLQVLGPLALESNSRWIKMLLIDGREAYIQRGDVTFSQTLLNKDQMCALSLQFLGLPYTWGGRSSFGYDCSGFVQMLYRQMGVSLPRDTKDQIHSEGFEAVALSSLLPGDLIFFGLAEDKIRHVGMNVGGDKFIHATVAENRPYIRFSHLADPEWNGSGKLIYSAARRLKA